MLESRLAIISEKLEKYGNVEVKQLSREFGVTEKTIRHDLTRMEKMGLLKRVHGGAVSNIKQAEDAYLNSNRMIALKSKELIARAAFDYIRQVGTFGQVLFIDAGTTNYEFARYLKNQPSTIITNDLLIASNLSTRDGAIHLTGGQLCNNVNKYLVGPDAIDMIQKHAASICFVGAGGISLKDGFMTQTNEDAAVKRAMISRSDFSICLADHLKFDRMSFVKYADISDYDLIITDMATEEQIKAYEAMGVKILVAGENIPARQNEN